MKTYLEYVSEKCKQLSSKREIALLDEKINLLNDKKAELTQGKKEIAVIEKTAKMRTDVTIKKHDLIVDVAANIAVKDICRNIERKIKRNLSSKSESDKQELYNHLFYFYSLKHSNTLPTVYGKNKNYHINDYVSIRTNSVINDKTCHINFS